MSDAKEKQKDLFYSSNISLNEKKNWKNQNKNLAISTLTKCSGALILHVPPSPQKILPKVFSELKSELTQDWEKSHPDRRNWTPLQELTTSNPYWKLRQT